MIYLIPIIYLYIIYSSTVIQCRKYHGMVLKFGCDNVCYLFLFLWQLQLQFGPPVIQQMFIKFLNHKCPYSAKCFIYECWITIKKYFAFQLFQLPLAYLKTGYLSVPPQNDSLATHNDWRRLWFVLDHEALYQVKNTFSLLSQNGNVSQYIFTSILKH